MKQKALDIDIKLGPEGNFCDRVNLFEQGHDMVLVFIVFFCDTAIRSQYTLVGEYWFEKGVGGNAIVVILYVQHIKH